MVIERMSEERWGWRVLFWKIEQLNTLSWKKHWYKFAVRIYRDTYGIQVSLTIAP
jgi:hypothetical protein